MATTPRPTIHDFASGTLYGAAKVAGLFDKTLQWVRDKIKAGRLSAAKFDGVGPWLISGESVRILYGSLLLAADVATPDPTAVPIAKAVKNYRAELAALNASKNPHKRKSIKTAATVTAPKGKK